jgi:hypothetical protein
MVDLRGGLQWQGFDLTVALRNALNTNAQISADTSGLSQDPNAAVRMAIAQPRTVQATLSYHY